MRLWIDAQLPPTLANWIKAQCNVDACNLDVIGLRGADDVEIFEALRRPGEVILSKDDDFVDLVTRLGTPPQLLWVTCGNVTNRSLRVILNRSLDGALALLANGEPVVELASR